MDKQKKSHFSNIPTTPDILLIFLVKNQTTENHQTHAQEKNIKKAEFKKPKALDVLGKE